MAELVRASLSIERELMEGFDAFVERSGHGNRSEAMRDLIRARLLEERWEEQDGEAIATVTLLYDHNKRDISRQLEEHGHDHHEEIIATMHVHISSAICLEVIALRGQARQLHHIANHLIGMPGVLHGKVVHSRADVQGALR